MEVDGWSLQNDISVTWQRAMEEWWAISLYLTGLCIVVKKFTALKYLFLNLDIYSIVWLSRSTGCYMMCFYTVLPKDHHFSSVSPICTHDIPTMVHNHASCYAQIKQTPVSVCFRTEPSATYAMIPSYPIPPTQNRHGILNACAMV